MSSPPIPDALRVTAPNVARGVAIIFAAIVALAAHAFLRHPTRIRLTIPIWTRFNRAARRFERLMARVAAGTFRPPRPRHTPRPPRPSGHPDPNSHPYAHRLPSGNGWLSSALSYQGRGYASQLTHLLTQPETLALLAEIPQAARILRPLCQMLGVWPTTRAPRKRQPPRPREPRPEPTPRPARPPPAPRRRSVPTSAWPPPCVPSPNELAARARSPLPSWFPDPIAKPF